MPTKSPQQFIILPPRGLTAAGATAREVQDFFVRLENTRRPAGGPRRAMAAPPGMRAKMQVIDSIHENGPKLVEMAAADMAALRAEQPGVRVVPLRHFHVARAPRPELASKVKVAAAGGLSLVLTLVSKADGVTPVAGAEVLAFTDFAARTGAKGKTNKSGQVKLALGGASKKLERLYVYAESGYWNALLKNVTVKNGGTLALQPITLPFTDALRHFYKGVSLDEGGGVTVGVIDTGIGPHSLLNVAGGINTVTGEQPADWADNGDGHGTHVAGIIAARGATSGEVRGVAPGVTLRSYRVFGKGADGASNFSIAKAIDRAVADGCDLINMSLGGGDADEATHSAIVDARAAGVLVFVATGNDERSPVSFPASDSLSLAITALGRKGTFPTGTTQAAEVVGPYGTDKKNFIAGFSNVGPEVDLTGPGLGIISTLHGNRIAIMDGTSMACPAVTGAAARLLATLPAVMGLPRDQARSDAMAKAILQAVKNLGLPPEMQGSGLIP